MRLLRFLIVVLLLTASFGQLNRLFLGDADNVVLYANDLLMGVVAVWYLAAAIIERRSWRISPVMMVLFGWLLVGLIGLGLSWPALGASEIAVSLFYWIRYTSYLALFFVAYDSLSYAKTEEQAQRMAGWWAVAILVAMLLMAIGGFIQLYILPDLSGLAKYGWDPHIDRLVTAMLDPNFAGCYLSIGAGVAISLFLHIKHRLEVQAGLLLTICVLLVAILLTYSRSGYIMLAGVLGVIAIVKSRVLLLVGVVMAVLAIAFIPRVQDRLSGALTVDASAQPRIISWQNSWQIASHNWALGTGFNDYRYAQDRYGVLTLDQSGNAGAGADSSWLFILATTGIVGLAMYVAHYVSLIWLAARSYARLDHPVGKALALSLVAILMGLAVASQFNNSLFYTWILEPLWILAGVVVAWSEGLAVPITRAKLAVTK